MAELTKLRQDGGFEVRSAELLFDIKNFVVELENGEAILSPVYTIGEGELMTQWRIQVYPNGNSKESQGHVSVYLELTKGSKSEPAPMAKFNFYIFNQNAAKLNQSSSGLRKHNKKSSNWGYSKFILASEIMKPEYSHNGTVTIGCDLTIYHEIKTEPNPEAKVWQPPIFNFSNLLWELYQEEELTDVTLVVGGDIIKCHKTVLSAASAVFKKMFMNKDMLESQTGIVKVNNLSLEVVKKLVEFLYKGHINDFEEATSSDLYIAADFYQVPDLVRLCEYHLLRNLSAETVLEVLYVADKFKNSVLLERGLMFLTQNPDLMKTEEYEKMLELNPKLSVAIIAELCKKLGSKCN